MLIEVIRPEDLESLALTASPLCSTFDILYCKMNMMSLKCGRIQEKTKRMFFIYSSSHELVWLDFLSSYLLTAILFHFVPICPCVCFQDRRTWLRPGPLQLRSNLHCNARPGDCTSALDWSRRPMVRGSRRLHSRLSSNDAAFSNHKVSQLALGRATFFFILTRIVPSSLPVLSNSSPAEKS